MLRISAPAHEVYYLQGVLHDMRESMRQDYLNDNVQYGIGNTRKTYSQTSIKPPPDKILIQFIGGPFNTEQKYVPWREYNTFDGKIMRFALNEGLPSLPHETNAFSHTIEAFDYRLKFVRMDETPFSDAQIAVGIFQE